MGGWFMSASGLTSWARLQLGQQVGRSDFRLLAPAGDADLPRDPWEEGYRVGWEGA